MAVEAVIMAVGHVAAVTVAASEPVKTLVAPALTGVRPAAMLVQPVVQEAVRAAVVTVTQAVKAPVRGPAKEPVRNPANSALTAARPVQAVAVVAEAVQAVEGAAADAWLRQWQNIP